jgi:iron complex transport system ATP-binding protein
MMALHGTSLAGSASPLIEGQRISFSLNGVSLLREVSLRVRAGETVGLIGPNGAGKTTLLKVLGGLIRDVEGEVWLQGRPLREYSPREVARLVAHVPQTTALDFAFTVREVVLMGRSPYLGRFQLEQPLDRQVAEQAMRTMNVQALSERFINTLSGGERQRVLIARALAQQPRILLLDEPTANLDVKHQLEVLSLTTRLAHQQGLAIVAAIHDLDLAARFFDRLVLLHEGRVLADSTPEVVLTPSNLAEAFGVQANIYRDPFTQVLRLSLSGDGSNGHRVVSQASIPL